MMLSAAGWSALFEGVGAMLLLWNLLNGVLLYRMQAAFVTRGEFQELKKGVADNGDALNKVNNHIGRLVTTEQVGSLYDRLGRVESQGASVAAEVSGIGKQLHAANNMLQMLVKNEIDGAARK